MNNMKDRVFNPEELRKMDLKNNIFTKCFRITSIEKYYFYVKSVETPCVSCREGCTQFNCHCVLIKNISPNCLVLFPNEILVGIIIAIVVYSLEKRRQVMKFRDVCIFEMRKSNVDFDTRVGESLYSNKTKLMFDGLDSKFIPVGKETKDLIYIRNDNADMMKIQFTTKEDTDRYEIRTNPQIIILKRYEACEFEIFIKPLCTTSLEDTIRLVTANMKKGVEKFNEVHISSTTQLSTKLDPNELIEEEVLGEGSFGTVYRGTFRGQKVAIKKMKNLENEGDQKKLIEEFDKKVSMLEKFRSICVINFVGAVYLVKKIAIVTE